MNSRQSSIFLILLSVLVTSILLWLNIISPGLEGGMDSYNHYLISKFSWQNPELFLDYWGKPVFNVLASPFAQFGLNGMFVLNLLSLLGSALLAYKIAQHLELKHYAFLAFTLALLSPIFLDNTISALTEPMCAFLVCLTFYFLVKDQNIPGAIVAGLLPHARSEGFIILFVVFLYFVMKRESIKTFLYLGLGSLIFNTLGWIITGQPFWIFTENPYINFEMSGNNICGSGGLFHYAWAAPYTFGLGVSALALIALLVIAFRIVKERKINLKLNVVALSFVLYILAHALIWYKGMMGSCGYIRVMVVVAPLAAILGAYAFQQIAQFIDQKYSKMARTITSGLLLVLIAHVLYVPYRYYIYKYPLTISEEQEQFEELNRWYQEQDYKDRTKLYLYPYFSIIADINPYNQDEHLELWASSLQWTKKGDILIWDGHFGPNESGLPLDTLKANEEWQLIHSIIPKKTIKTLNDYNFEIHVFEKIK